MLIMQRLIKILQRNVILVTMILLGGIIRMFGLGAVPPSLNWDEISHGYNAYSILETGKDEWGERLPLIFRAYGDYKLPVYIYTTIPGVAVFGLSEFSVRLTSAVAGTLLILFTYLLAFQLFNRRYVALLAALFMTIEPWSFFLSRIAVEANLALFFIVAGIWFTLSGLLREKWWFILGALFLGLSVWTYNSARVFVPLLLVTLIFIYRYELIALWRAQKLFIIHYSLFIILFFLPMFYQLIIPAGQARYNWVAILDEGAISQIDNRRNTSNLPGPLPRLLNNKIVYFLDSFGKNYLSYFSPDFLFSSGGTQYQFSVPGKGLIYPTEALLIAIGLLWIIKKRSKETTLILAWILLAPVAASLTRESQHALRSIVMMPVPQILSGVGLIVAWGWIRKKKLKSLALIIYIICLLYYAESYIGTYIGTYKTTYSWSWQYGYKEAVQFIKDHYNEYDQIIVTKKYGEPHEFVLFYLPWDPEKYVNDPNLIRFGQSEWYWVDRFDRFYFINDWQVPKMDSGKWIVESGSEIPINSNTLLVTSPGNYPPGWKMIKTINFLDNRPAFDILEK